MKFGNALDGISVRWAIPAWGFPLFSVVLAAVAIRVMFFNGPLGSDDLVYLARSLDVADGVWSSANYNGALRYGYNIPSGFFIRTFGLNMATANLWPLLCSIVEIGAVFLFAWFYLGKRVAWIAGAFLIFMPLHVALATRLDADSVVSMFISVAFILFYAAEKKASRSLYFITGLALGGVYWTKELATLTIFAFLFYPLYARRMDWRWVFVGIGGLVMLLAHFVLMQVIAGDPLHAMKTVLGQVQHSFVAAGHGEDSPWYYFRYLFVTIEHVWLAPWIALVTTIIVWHRRGAMLGADAFVYTLFWFITLFGLLSFFPVSFSPLRFAMKQPNYISLFIAPIAILAAFGAAALPPSWSRVLVGVVLAGGLVLSALEQQVYQVFTSNSKALLAFSLKHPGARIYGSVNNGSISEFYQLLGHKPKGYYRVYELGEMPRTLGQESNEPVFTVVDRETLGWGKADKAISAIPGCWEKVSVLKPAGMGNGRYILKVTDGLLQYVPGSPGKRLRARFRGIGEPATATVYRVKGRDLWCDEEKGSA